MNTPRHEASRKSGSGSAGARLHGLVLAAGRGTRMKSATPKVLHPVLGQPLLEYPLRVLEHCNAVRNVVVVGFGADQVTAQFQHRQIGEHPLSFALQDPPRGTGDAVQIGLRAFASLDGVSDEDAVLILNGDLPMLRGETIADFVNAHRASGADMTVLAVRVDDPTGYGRLVLDDDREIDQIVEHADASNDQLAIRDVNAGVYIARVGALRDGLEAWIAEDPGNSQGEIYLPPVVGPIRRSGGHVKAYWLPDAASDELRQVNDRVELSQAVALRRALRIVELQRSGVTVVDPDSTYVEEDVEIGQDTTLLPFTVITGRVRIGTGCSVGPFTHLRDGTVLEDGSEVGNFTEVKKSRLGQRTKAKHLSYIGNATIGDDTNVGAGTVIANYDGAKKWPTAVGSGAFIGSGSLLIAPCEVEDGGRTGAGAVVPPRSRVPAGETAVGVPARIKNDDGELERLPTVDAEEVATSGDRIRAKRGTRS